MSVFALKRMKILTAVIVTMLLLFGILGFTHFGMNTAIAESTGPCPFIPGLAICNMTPIQHIAAAQSIFTSIPLEKDALFALLLLSLAFFAASFVRRIASPPLMFSPVAIALRQHAATHSSLHEAYARGILSPKIF